jgi:hypothetical protein
LLNGNVEKETPFILFDPASRKTDFQPLIPAVHVLDLIRDGILSRPPQGIGRVTLRPTLA